MQSQPRPCRRRDAGLKALALAGVLWFPASVSAQEPEVPAGPDPEAQEPAPSPTDPWSVEDLREHSEGFHESSLIAGLTEIGNLVAEQDDAFAAICVTIQGDHREYQLRIEKLLDQLADDRWLSREDAERSLIEIGGRALGQIEARAAGGETLEERVRCERILQAIHARGTEAEEAEIRLLRGLTATAAYLRADPRLVMALRSALDHSDPIVRENAARALGAVGDADQVARLNRLILDAPSGSRLRRAAMGGLSWLSGAEALAAMASLLREPDTLLWSERAALLRGLAARQDAAALLEELAADEDPSLAEMARSAALVDRGDDGPAVTLSLSGGEDAQIELLGIGCDSLRVLRLVDTLDLVELPLLECRSARLGEAPSEVETARMFLTQGSLLCGELLGIDEQQVRFESPWFGSVEVPRELVQGLALDPGLDRMIGASDDHDRLRLLADGDLVDGRLEGLQDGILRLRRPDGELREIPLDEVAGVLFRRARQTERDAEIYTRVDSRRGDRLLVHLVAAGPTSLGVVLPSLGGATPPLAGAALPLAEVARIEFEVGGGALWGFTLIADYSDNRIIEVDESGREVFSLDEVYGAWDAECLDSGNLLITEFALNRVIEVTRDGEEVWVYDELRNPYDADRLPNGNTLIADTFGDRVIEVSPQGEVVWELSERIRKPYDADRLAGGNTLVADGGNARVVEFDSEGKVVWELRNLENVHDADRLPNGNTLITQRTAHRVIEVDRDGAILFSLEGLSSPSDADRLPNGHTLVAENGWVREFDRQGLVVWSHQVAWAVEVNRY